MSKRQATVLGFAIALLLASVLPLLALATARPALEIRAVPWQLPAGKMFPGHSLGQTFRYPGHELSRIDVLFVRQPGQSASGLKLTLREDGPSGALLRTSELQPTTESNAPQFLTFAFPKVEYTTDRTFHFEVEGLDASGVCDWSPWISWRGRSGAALPWGDHTVSPADARIEVKCLRDNLSAVALAVDGLNVPAGDCLLEVRQVGSEEVVREGRLVHNSPIAGGYALFSFSPIARSRWIDYEFRFVLPVDARVVATERGISTISLHGPALEAESSYGMTHGGRSLAHRDLIFRAAGDTQVFDQLELFFERMPWPRALAAWMLSWIAGGWVLAFFLTGLAPRAGQE